MTPVAPLSRRNRIILASASPQRKKLLKLLDINFSVKPSRIKEEAAMTTSCAALVKRNALRKARDIARRSPNAVVIGADTVVYLGKKRIVGKPRSRTDAKKILAYMCRRPQWVYTGVAVINTRTKKTVVGYEKTKVYMAPLSGRQISRYHRHPSLLEKAGGFDIQGRGGMFIRRIEGCYYNVVGLPLAKLCLLLKKVGVHLLVFLAMVQSAGCATEYNLATQRKEMHFYSTEREVRLGESLSRQFDREFEINTNAALNERVSTIGRRIVEVCDRQELTYTFKIIEKDEVNAVSLPGGFVYIFRGLIDFVDNDDQLAAVIAHEIGHIAARHSVKKLQSIYSYSFLTLLAVQAGQPGLAQGIDMAFASVFFQYSREDEFLADQLSVKYLSKAGYDPSETVAFLKKIRRKQEREPSRQYSYWRTHPYVSQRIAAVRREISGELEFRDYINLLPEE